ncbi:MAG: hypothetical protein KBT57_08485 [bacterium]|nr:hypothetical protein [Candidatus Limimorpha equi]
MAYYTNSDKILQAVLSDVRLSEVAEYNPDDFDTVASAKDSDNPIVHAVAIIVEKVEQDASDKEIYNEVSNYLKNNI